MSHARRTFLYVFCVTFAACSGSDRRAVLPTDGIDTNAVRMQRARVSSSDAAASSLLRTLRSPSGDRFMSGIDTAALGQLLSKLPSGLAPMVRSSYQEHGGPFFELLSIGGVAGADSLLGHISVARGRQIASAHAAAGATNDVWTAPVIVSVLANGTGEPSTFTVRREPLPNARDFVILHSGATESDLEQALRVLALLRRRDGIRSAADRASSLTLRSNMPVPRNRPASWARYLNTVMTRLEDAEPRFTPGVGWARVIELESLGH